MDAPENVGGGCLYIYVARCIIVMRSDFFFLWLNQQQAFSTFGTDFIGIAFFIPIQCNNFRDLNFMQPCMHS